MQKLPLQPPYYDMAPSESTPFTDKLVSSGVMSGFKGASLWRGHPQLLPLARYNCQGNSELSVLLCLEVLENWFTNETQSCDALWMSLRILNSAASAFARLVLKGAGSLLNELTSKSTGCFEWALYLTIYISTTHLSLQSGRYLCVLVCVCPKPNILSISSNATYWHICMATVCN